MHNSDTPRGSGSGSGSGSGQDTRIDALLTTLSPLLLSAPDKVSEILPHTARHFTLNGQAHVPPLLHRKLLDTVATLCSLHAQCVSAAVALEVAADRATLHIAADAAPAALRRDVQSWIASVRDVAEDSDALSGSVNIEEHSETQLMATVYRACYAKIRARIREGGQFVETIRKLSEQVPDRRPVQDGQPVDVEEDPDTPLGKLCMNLELLMSCMEPETAEESDEIRLVAACIAGWSADQALREDWMLCRTVDGIDNGALQTIREVCVLSGLVDTLVAIAKCGAVSLTLPMHWTVEWVEYPTRPSTAASERSGGAPSDADSSSPAPTLHPESLLIRHIVDNALPVHPYIATSALPCYPCVMLVRSVNLSQATGIESGTGQDFTLRGCDARAVLPWSPPWAHGESQSATGILRELEMALERDWGELQSRRAGKFSGQERTLRILRELHEAKSVPVKVKWADSAAPAPVWRTEDAEGTDTVTARCPA